MASTSSLRKLRKYNNVQSTASLTYVAAFISDVLRAMAMPYIALPLPTILLSTICGLQPPSDAIASPPLALEDSTICQNVPALR